LLLPPWQAGRLPQKLGCGEDLLKMKEQLGRKPMTLENDIDKKLSNALDAKASKRKTRAQRLNPYKERKLPLSPSGSINKRRRGCPERLSW
jgi:hypothetical protein